MVALAAVPNVAIVYIIDCYRNRTANVMMVLNSSRNCIGAGFLFATVPVVQRIGVQKVQNLMFSLLTAVVHSGNCTRGYHFSHYNPIVHIRKTNSAMDK